jgi:hypothetical protein
LLVVVSIAMFEEWLVIAPGSARIVSPSSRSTTTCAYDG